MLNQTAGGVGEDTDEIICIPNADGDFESVKRCNQEVIKAKNAAEAAKAAEAAEAAKAAEAAEAAKAAEAAEAAKAAKAAKKAAKKAARAAEKNELYIKNNFINPDGSQTDNQLISQRLFDQLKKIDKAHRNSDSDSDSDSDDDNSATKRKYLKYKHKYITLKNQMFF